ncbi:MAG: hypothetical protein EPO68_05395 [Planctomycetota bacterium]|nr:MAG: hypothetical protein EPO68_05395 [Planctomycetota bacterium]
MLRTARRRWSRELPSLIDGLALGASGPVIVHGYDQPAGGKWIDNVIPGRLLALDRTSGEIRWNSPCEVGYGRGFGAGLGSERDVVVLGPGQQGHRIARMNVDNGELLAAREIGGFDEARVDPDLCICIAPRRIAALRTSTLAEVWTFGAGGERYHGIARDGDHLWVVYKNERLGRQGVLCIDVGSGEPIGRLLEPRQRSITGLTAEAGLIAMVVSNVEEAIPPDALQKSAIPTAGGARVRSGIALLVLSARNGGVERPLWCCALEGELEADFPDVGLRADSGKLYIARGATLEVRDLVSGRMLGQQTVPGLDEHVAWTVAHGAVLLAEETRISIFEVPD